MEKLQMIQFISDHKYILLTLMGAIMVALGVFKASIEQKKAEKKANELSEQLKAESAEVKRLSELTIQLQSVTINNLKYQTNMITGGDSFPFVQPKFDLATPQNFDLTLMNTGIYPLYDVTVEIEDLRLLKEVVKNKPKGCPLNSADYTKYIKVNNMYPKQMVFTFYSMKIPDDGEIHLRVSLCARNCFVSQVIAFSKANTKERVQTKDEMELNRKKYDPKKAFELFFPTPTPKK